MSSGNPRAGGDRVVRRGLFLVVTAVVAGAFRWVQARTWRDTVHLALWLVMSWVFAAFTLIGLLVVFVAGRASARGMAVRASVLHLLAETVRVDLRRIEFFSGVQIQPLALAHAASGAPWRERRRAFEPVPSQWRLPAYELASAAVTAGVAAWWWGTIACFVLLTEPRPFYNESVIHLFSLSIGPSQLLSTDVIAPWLGAVVGVVMWPTVVRAVPVLDVALARRLLGPSPSELSREVDRLSGARAQAVAAADAERRRIERDLHDGFQPQLVNLALNLGLARSRMASDPDGARSLLDRAHDDAKQATEDLRNLVRGIHPSVLDERGLDAAFSALAARSGVPLQIDVHLEQRPPREPEGIAYFVAAEAITNINKHARAGLATITITEIAGSLRVVVYDDGEGGARPEPGGGLAGLAARVAGVDGTFSVTSPEGGPTWIEARIPCGW